MGVSAPLEIGTDQDRPRGGDSFRDMLEWWRMRGKKCHSTLFANKSDASRTTRRWWRQSQWTVLIKKINRVFINIPANPRFWPPPATIYIYICKRPRNKMSLGKWKTKLQIARLISPFPRFSIVAGLTTWRLTNLLQIHRLDGGSLKSISYRRVGCWVEVGQRGWMAVDQSL